MESTHSFYINNKKRKTMSTWQPTPSPRGFIGSQQRSCLLLQNVNTQNENCKPLQISCPSSQLETCMERMTSPIGIQSEQQSINTQVKLICITWMLWWHGGWGHSFNSRLIKSYPSEVLHCSCQCIDQSASLNNHCHWTYNHTSPGGA